MQTLAIHTINGATVLAFTDHTTRKAEVLHWGPEDALEHAARRRDGQAVKDARCETAKGATRYRMGGIVEDKTRPEPEAYAIARDKNGREYVAGDRVRLISSAPRYGFGLVDMGEVGVVIGFGRDRDLMEISMFISFPSQSRWEGFACEVERIED